MLANLDDGPNICVGSDEQINRKERNKHKDKQKRINRLMVGQK